MNCLDESFPPSARIQCHLDSDDRMTGSEHTDVGADQIPTDVAADPDPDAAAR